jgi:pimeloyl-ACP methyl ester carboxylesterase
LNIIHNGSEAEHANFINNEGTLIALFVDGLIQSLSLPKNGGVTVGGWSLGNMFTIAMRASINDLPDETKQRLKAYTRGFIVFDAPNVILGYKTPDNVIQMKDIPEEERAAFFPKFVSSYYKHGDLSSREFSQLEQVVGDASRKPTTETMTPEELQSIMDFGPAAQCEIVFIGSPSFLSLNHKQAAKAFFDPQIREAWGGQLVSCVYCENSLWNPLYGAWNLEKEAKASEINFKLVPNANHFLMWAEPNKFLSIMKECFSA